MAAYVPNSTLRELIRPDGIAPIWCDGHELLRRIFITVRDSGWREVGPTHWESAIDEVTRTVTLRARHINELVDFEWEATLCASHDLRELRFELTGKALRDMEVCRVGLVILHPVNSMVGSRLSATGPGLEQHLTVTETISPQPVVDGIPQAMTDPFSELVIEQPDFGTAAFRFEGDLFELEDQRNWGDASFKTYCTPLRVGFPRTMNAGTSIAHSVQIRFKPALKRETSHVIASSRVELGVFPTIGRQWCPRSTPASSPQREPPWHCLHFQMAAVTDTAILRSLLESVSPKVQIGVTADLIPTSEVLDLLSTHRERVSRVTLWGPDSSPPPAAVVERWRRHFETASGSPHLPFLAGTRGYYVEFNRAIAFDVPISGIAFPLTATVHSDDPATIADNVVAIRDMSETARRLTGLSEIVVAPLALYHPQSAIPRNFPVNLLRPWLAATLIHAALARIASVTLANDVVEAIDPSGSGTSQFISRLIECASFEVTPLETSRFSRLHAAAFGLAGRRPDRILAANLGWQSAVISPAEIGLQATSATDAATGAPIAMNEREVEVRGFETVWIGLR